MQNSNGNFEIFAKEWRSKRLTLGAIYGAALLALAYLMGQGSFQDLQMTNLIPIGLITAISMFILGNSIFSNEERDPSRGFLYQLPISRQRFLTIKLLALICQVLLLMIALGLTFTLILARYWGDVYPPQESHKIFLSSWRQFVTFISSIFAAGLALAFLAAIVSLHIRSAVVALVMTALIAFGIGFLIFLPFVDSNFSSDYILRKIDLPIHLAITALLLLIWIFFLFCRTRIQELSPTSRALLALLFGLVLLEVVFTIVYTGWSDLGYLIFGI